MRCGVVWGEVKCVEVSCVAVRCVEMKCVLW